MLIFHCLCLLYVLLFLLKLLLSWSYQNRKKQDERLFDEGLYTIVQPILSGDPRLAEDLEANLKNSSDFLFLWLIDEDDWQAHDITTSLLQNPNYTKRVTVQTITSVPQATNPKSFKLNQAIDNITTPYMIVLDDDAVVDFDKMRQVQVYEQLDEFLATGLPYNHTNENFWSRLLAAFVNGNSFLTYPTMARIQQNHSINGMFYWLPVAVAKKYHLFHTIQHELCDDLAVAEVLSKNKVPLFQTMVTCNVRTTIKDSGHYLRQMKRWLIFSLIYMKRHASPSLFILIALPIALPLILILSAWSLHSLAYLYLFLLFFIKSLIMKYYRYFILGKKEEIYCIFYEILGDLILPFLSIYTIFTPKIIRWRNKNMIVTDGKIHYD